MGSPFRVFSWSRRQGSGEAEAIANDQKERASGNEAIILSAIAQEFGAEYDRSESDK